METNSISQTWRRSLRTLAAIVFIAGIGAWLASGARVGWTQTSTVAMQRDEITGIDYPVRQAAFVAGVEVPVLASALAATFAAASFIPRRATTVRA